MNTIRIRPWLLPILAFCSFLVGYDSIATIPLLPEIAKTTHMSLQAGGLLYTSYAIAYAIAAPIIGNLSDRWSRKGMLIIGMILFGFSTAMVGFAKTTPTLILFRALTGVGAGMIEPMVYAIVGDAYPYEKRGQAIGMVTAAFIASSIIGVPFAGLIAEWTMWNWALWSIAILSGLALIAIIIGVPFQKSKTNKKGLALAKTLGSVISNTSVLFSLLGSLLYYGALQGMFALTGIYYHTYFGLGAGETGLILMVAGVSSVMGSILGGKLADLWSKKGVVAMASFLSAFLVFFLSWLTDVFWLSVTLHVLWAAWYAIGQSAFTALISELNPSYRGTVMALNSSTMYIGAGLLSAIATGLLQTGVFWQIGLLCGFANLLVMMITLLAIREQPISHHIKNADHN